MKYRCTALMGIAFGVAANVLGVALYPGLLGTYGIGVGSLAACCGCLVGYVLDKNSTNDG